MEQVWAQALERKETEKLVTGILEQIVNNAVDIAQIRTVVRTPAVLITPQTEPTNVFKQMDTPVRDWCMEPIHQAVEAQIHQRPVTPNIRSPANTIQAPCGWNSLNYAQETIGSHLNQGYCEP